MHRQIEPEHARQPVTSMDVILHMSEWSIDFISKSTYKRVSLEFHSGVFHSVVRGGPRSSFRLGLFSHWIFLMCERRRQSYEKRNYDTNIPWVFLASWLLAAQ